MEGVKIRAIAAVCVLLVAGGAIAFTKRATGSQRDENWMIENLPTSFGDYRMQSSPEDPRISYTMGKVTYDTLDPYGIVARVFESESNGETYDTVVIASSSKDSFHDPRVCFSAQGWSLANQWVEMVSTKSRGDVPVTLVLMDGPDGRNKIAAFLYKGPTGFYGSTQRLKVAMFMEQLKGGSNLDGAFYRFIPTNFQPDDPEQTTKLKLFVAEFIDAANATSGGYF